MKFSMIPLLLGTFTATVEAAFTTTTYTSGFLEFQTCESNPLVISVVPIGVCIHDSTTQQGGKAVKYTTTSVIEDDTDADQTEKDDIITHAKTAQEHEDCVVPSTPNTDPYSTSGKTHEGGHEPGVNCQTGSSVGAAPPHTARSAE